MSDDIGIRNLELNNIVEILDIEFQSLVDIPSYWHDDDDDDDIATVTELTLQFL